MAAALHVDVAGAVVSGAMNATGPVEVDAVVVGGGPAGATAARELARAGASVVLLERQPLPRWKVCGSCLGPVGLQVLEDLGLGGLPVARGAVPLSGVQLTTFGGRTAWVALPGGIAWSRRDMDLSLVEEAGRAGARVWSGTTAEIGEPAPGYRVVRARAGSNETLYHARVVVDAAGVGGASSELAGPARPASRIGLGAVLKGGGLQGMGAGSGDGGGQEARVAPGRIEMVVGTGGYVGLVRLADGTVDVAAAVDVAAVKGLGPAGAVDAILAEARLELAGSLVGGWRGTPALTRAPSRVAGARLLRVGDAMGYVEPFTGEGMGWALASGAACVPVALQGIGSWHPDVEAAWEEYRARRAEPARRLCRAVSWGLRRPLLVKTAIVALQRFPALAHPVVRGVTRSRAAA